MSHAEVCPVCKGTGKVKEYDKHFSPFGFNFSSSFSFTEKTCHGCLGKGWITVTDTSDILKYDYSKRSTMNINTNIEE